MNRYFYISLGAHIIVLSFFIFSFYSASMLPVFENTNEQDVISAVILGDSVKSKIVAPPQTIPQMKNQEPLPAAKTKLAASNEKDVIAIKPQKDLKKQKLAELNDLFGKNLLADIKKTKEKQKLQRQKQAKATFEKMLKQQAEQSMRQQIMDEDLKSQNDQVRKAQGMISKYKALILQDIGKNWIVPPQVNRKLTLSVMIHLDPAGHVLEVRVTKSSGNQALDSSVLVAINKASPLSVPSKPEEFEVFRQFILKVKPENILPNQ